MTDSRGLMIFLIINALTEINLTFDLMFEESMEHMDMMWLDIDLYFVS